MTRTSSADKLMFANMAVEKFVPEIKRRGIRLSASATWPRAWQLDDVGLHFCFSENVLLSPIEPVVSSLLDIWPGDGGQKVLSVSWYPSLPWYPKRVIAFKKGPWMDQLG